MRCFARQVKSVYTGGPEKSEINLPLGDLCDRNLFDLIYTNLKNVTSADTLISLALPLSSHSVLCAAVSVCLRLLWKTDFVNYAGMTHFVIMFVLKFRSDPFGVPGKNSSRPATRRSRTIDQDLLFYFSPSQCTLSLTNISRENMDINVISWWQAIRETFPFN